ncbi:hypothetical protein [Chitinophaga ginsengisoli]|uniref:Uncharacterized protein n=1 Tax=Chitinophaga ginsengisoli TaxID=363837 RepID=A0A2P8GKG8_9BACT|nr:hypothetical protein [Chitinophaga ginsengisoli]PSL34456.1 hypothetical protein CLV42_10227 [Chitinophaga ginsengisoli]
MMQLKKGITIHNKLPERYDALSINSGTVYHTEQEAPPVNFQGLHYTPRYIDGAYVIKRDWRPLNGDEIRCLQANGQRTDYSTIYLGDIPEQLKDLFQSLSLNGAGNRDEVMEKLAASPEKTKALSEQINAFLQPLANQQPFKFHCIGINFPNIELVACNTTRLPAGYKPQDIRYMGMHNDGTRDMTIYTANKAGNRISINIGEESRSFLFVNLSMVQAINMLKKKIDIAEHNVNIANIGRFFFQYYPDYPVIKIRQKPYQYYIAPTDNCFHDGSTLGSSTLDVTMVYFGNFQY